MFKVNNKTARTTPWRRSGVFIVNFEHISPLFLVFLLLILNMQMPAGSNSFIPHITFIWAYFTKSRNLKKLLKKNNATVLDYLFTKKMFKYGIGHDIDSAYGICMH